MWSLAKHWHGPQVLSNHVWCSYSHIHVTRNLSAAPCESLQLGQSVLPINHVIEIPRCLLGFVNHDFYDIMDARFTMIMIVHSRLLSGSLLRRGDCRDGGHRPCPLGILKLFKWETPFTVHRSTILPPVCTCACTSHAHRRHWLRWLHNCHFIMIMIVGGQWLRWLQNYRFTMIMIVHSCLVSGSSLSSGGCRDGAHRPSSLTEYSSYSIKHRSLFTIQWFYHWNAHVRAHHTWTGGH